MSEAEGTAFTGREMRDALGLFPTGVAVITAQAQSGERLGATVSSFNSVSLDPPLILFSLAKDAKSIAAWEAAEHFAVNVLGEHQSQVSTRFAKALTDKWEGIKPLEARRIGAPLIRDARYAFGGLAVVLLLLIAWGPTQGARTPVTIVIVTVLAVVGLVVLRRQTAGEVAAAPAQPAV